MLEKKELVQKSFRIAKNLDSALLSLSKILNRSQNDLIEHAIRLLLKENEAWFANEFIDEYYHKIFENLYASFIEKIYTFELFFNPYNFQKKEGAYLILFEYDKDNESQEVFKMDVGNSPRTSENLVKGLGEIATIIIKKHPEIKEKYNIKSFDV